MKATIAVLLMVLAANVSLAEDKVIVSCINGCAPEYIENVVVSARRTVDTSMMMDFLSQNRSGPLSGNIEVSSSGVIQGSLISHEGDDSADFTPVSITIRTNYRITARVNRPPSIQKPPKGGGPIREP